MKAGDFFKCIKRGAYHKVIVVGSMRFGEGWVRSVTYQVVDKPAFHFTVSVEEFQRDFYAN